MGVFSDSISVRVKRSGVEIRPGAIEEIVRTSPVAEAMVKGAAEAIVAAAKADFLRQQRADNEWRTSEFTPPKYFNSFGVRKINHARKLVYQAYNNDPGAMLVEYGAHAGGVTFVLRYKPLTHATEIVGSAT